MQYKNLYYSFSPAVRILFILTVTLCLFLLSFLPLYFLGLLLFGIGFHEAAQFLQESVSDAYSGFQMYLQAAQTLALFILPSLVIARLFSHQGYRFLGFKRENSARLLILVVLASLSLIPLLNASGVLNEGLRMPDTLKGLENWMQTKEKDARELTVLLLKMESPLDLIRTLCIVSLLPAVGEELFFRGLLQPALQNWLKNSHLAVLLTAILFSGLHLQFYGFLPRFLLGLFYGYLFVWTANIWLPILAHLVNNALAVVLVWLHPEWALQEGLRMNNSNPVFWGALMLSMAFSAVFLLLIYQYGKENQADA